MRILEHLGLVAQREEVGGKRGGERGDVAGTDDVRAQRGTKDIRVGCGPSTGNIDNSVPKTKNAIATQAIGTESLSPV